MVPEANFRNSLDVSGLLPRDFLLLGRLLSLSRHRQVSSEHPHGLRLGQ